MIDMTESDRSKRRILATFSPEQVELIDFGVELGMALNRAEYIRKAVDKLNEDIPTYLRIHKQKVLLTKEKSRRLRELMKKAEELLPDIGSLESEDET